MCVNDVKLELLQSDDRENFIKDNQRAFKYGALEEFGLRDNHFEEDGEIISRATIETSINFGTAYRIFHKGRIVGGAVVETKGKTGELVLLFINPPEHSKGIGRKAWFAIESMYPKIEKWETFTPYFETRNIHFYVNKCGFHVVEYFNEFHRLSDRFMSGDKSDDDEDQLDGMFRFEKIIKGYEYANLSS